MCGIWGIVKNANQTRLQKFDLKPVGLQMMLTSLRGEHSTGMMWASTPYTGTNQEILYDWIRTVGNYYRLMDSKLFAERFLPFYETPPIESPVTVWGHGRHATLGEISIANAHPFEVDHIVLMHNGTIRTGLTIEKDKTDSEAIAIALAENNDPVAILNKLDGPYVLVWINKDKNTLSIARNTDRPLWKYKDSWATYFMSERSSLEFVMRKSLNTFVSTNLMEVAPWNIYTYPLDSAGAETVTPLEKKIKTHWQSTNYGGHSNYYKNYEDYYDAASKSTAPKALPAPKDSTTDVKPTSPTKLTDEEVYNQFRAWIGKNVTFQISNTEQRDKHRCHVYGYTILNPDIPDWEPVMYKTNVKGMEDTIQGDLYDGEVRGVEFYDGEWMLVLKTKSVSWVADGDNLDDLDLDGPPEDEKTVDITADLSSEEKITLQAELDNFAKRTKIVSKNKIVVNKEIYDTKAVEGCFSCQKPLDKEDPGNVTIRFSSNTAFDLYCENCQNDLILH